MRGIVRLDPWANSVGRVISAQRAVRIVIILANFKNMSSSFLHNYKQVALQAAKSAGRYLSKEFSRPTVPFNHKNDGDLVTSADKEVEKIILNLIKKNFPEHRILSEESGRVNWASHSPYLWLVDPIDGTTNFIFRNPLFAVSIALVRRHEIILGVICAPALKELYFAERGKKSFLNQRKLKVSQKNKLSQSFLTSGYSSRVKDRRLVLEFYPRIVSQSEHHRDLGSAALELAFIAAGRLDGAIILGARPFDIAAGVLVVQKAGGAVTNFKNEKWTIEDKYLIASNGLIHQKLLNIIEPTPH